MLFAHFCQPPNQRSVVGFIQAQYCVCVHIIMSSNYTKYNLVTCMTLEWCQTSQSHIKHWRLTAPALLCSTSGSYCLRFSLDTAITARSCFTPPTSKFRLNALVLRHQANVAQRQSCSSAHGTLWHSSGLVECPTNDKSSMSFDSNNHVKLIYVFRSQRRVGLKFMLCARMDDYC